MHTVNLHFLYIVIIVITAERRCSYRHLSIREAWSRYGSSFAFFFFFLCPVRDECIPHVRALALSSRSVARHSRIRRFRAHELLKAVYPRKRKVEAPNVGGGRSLAIAWSAASARASRYLSHKFLYSLLIHIANRLASQFVGVVNKLHFFVITRIIYFPLNRP